MQAVSIATGIVSAIPGGSDAIGGLLGGGEQQFPICVHFPTFICAMMVVFL